MSCGNGTQDVTTTQTQKNIIDDVCSATMYYVCPKLTYIVLHSWRFVVRHMDTTIYYDYATLIYDSHFKCCDKLIYYYQNSLIYCINIINYNSTLIYCSGGTVIYIILLDHDGTFI